MNKKKMLVFAPHPDDETLGCGGTIARKAREGYDVWIVVVTDGRHALSQGFEIDSDPTPYELKKIRKKETRSATRMLGVPEEKLVFLDFVDTELEKNEKEALEGIERILSKNPHPLEIYFPYEKDCNNDHQVVSRIVRTAINKLGVNAMLYRYTITRNYARIGPRIDAFLNLFQRNMTRVDISEFLLLKEAAIKEYGSMISIMSSKQKRPVMQDYKRYLKTEEIFFIDK